MGLLEYIVHCSTYSAITAAGIIVANLVSYRLKPSKIGGESLSKPPRLRNLVHCSTELNTKLKPAEIRGDISSEFVAGYSWF